MQKGDRTLKFRVYDCGRKEWLFDSEHAFNLYGETTLMAGIDRRRDGSHVKLMELNDLHEMQFIELKDVDGKDLFDGDFVYHSRDNRIYKIEWRKHSCGWALVMDDTVMMLSDLCQKYMKLAGNIYDGVDVSVQKSGKFAT